MKRKRIITPALMSLAAGAVMVTDLFGGGSGLQYVANLGCVALIAVAARLFCKALYESA